MIYGIILSVGRIRLSSEVKNFSYCSGTYRICRSVGEGSKHCHRDTANCGSNKQSLIILLQVV